MRSGMSSARRSVSTTLTRHGEFRSGLQREQDEIKSNLVNPCQSKINHPQYCHPQMLGLLMFINGFPMISHITKVVVWSALAQAELKKARQAPVDIVSNLWSFWVLKLDLEKLSCSRFWTSIGSLFSGETPTYCNPGIFLGEIRHFGQIPVFFGVQNLAGEIPEASVKCRHVRPHLQHLTFLCPFLSGFF